MRFRFRNAALPICAALGIFAALAACGGGGGGTTASLPVVQRAKTPSTTAQAQPSYSQFTTDALALKPLAYYPLNESSGAVAADLSGNGYNGTYVGAPTLGTTGLIPGDSDTAVTFSGKTQQVTLPALPFDEVGGREIAKQTLSVVAVIKDTGASGVIADYGGFGVGVSGGYVGFYIGDFGDINIKAVQLTPGVPHFVAVTCTCDTNYYTIQVWVDGKPAVNANPGATGSHYWYPASSIGYASTGLGYYNGVIQNVGIYQYYLTSADICTLAVDAGFATTNCPSPAPTPTPTPTATPVATLLSAPFVGAQNDLDVFQIGANGDVAPLYQVTVPGSNPLFANPTDAVTLPNGSVLVATEATSGTSTGNLFLLAQPTVSGSVTPIASVTNSLFSCPRSAGVDAAGNYYVLQGCANNWASAAIMKFPSGANGNVSAQSQIPASSSVSATPGILQVPMDIGIRADGTIYSTSQYTSGSSFEGEVLAFATNANGSSAAPIATIAGSSTNLGASTGGVALDGQGNIYVLARDDNGAWPFLNSGTTPVSNPRIVEFAANANGNVAPIATLADSNTLLNNPIKMRVDSSGGIYVADLGVGGILYFAPGANGNVAPTREIFGANTGLGVNNVQFVGL
jgi:hypothetical protein